MCVVSYEQQPLFCFLQSEVYSLLEKPDGNLTTAQQLVL